MSSQQDHLYDTSLTDEYIAAVNRRAEVVHDFRCHHHDDDDSFGRDTSTTTTTTTTAAAAAAAASLVKVILGPTSIHESEPVAFVIRNVLTPSECDDLIDASEDFGIEGGQKYVARSAKRTKNYHNADLSEKVERRIKHVLDAVFRDPSEELLPDHHPNEKENNEGRSNANANANDASSKASDNQTNRFTTSKSNSTYMGPLYGIHSNWRILRYDADGGDAFPAHQDQMDSFQKPKNDGSGRKDLVVSSHTLLLQLSRDDLGGGCTRFYPKGKIRLPSKQKDDEKNENNEGDDHLASFRRRQFDHAVDVLLPRGWALVFRQRGLLHAGQPLSVSSPCSKYVAQAGVLRVLPEGVLVKPSVFKNGPGVTKGAF